MGGRIACASLASAKLQDARKATLGNTKD